MPWFIVRKYRPHIREVYALFVITYLSLYILSKKFIHTVSYLVHKCQWLIKTARRFAVSTSARHNRIIIRPIIYLPKHKTSAIIHQ